MKNNYKIIFGLLLFAFNSFGQFNAVLESDFTPSNENTDFIKILKYDLNDDGFTDVLIDGGMVTNQSGENAPVSTALVMMGDGTGSFSDQINFPKPSVMHSVSDIGDYNNDGNPDLLMYGFWQNGFTLFTGTGEGTMQFDSGTSFTSGVHGYDAIF